MDEQLENELKAWEQLSDELFAAWLEDDSDQRFWHLDSASCKCTCNATAVCPIHEGHYVDSKTAQVSSSFLLSKGAGGHPPWLPVP